MKPPHSRGPAGSGRPPSDPSSRPHTRNGAGGAPVRENGPRGTGPNRSDPDRSGPGRSGAPAGAKSRPRTFGGNPGSHAKPDRTPYSPARDGQRDGPRSHAPRPDPKADRTHGSARGQIVLHDKMRGDRVLGQAPAPSAPVERKPYAGGKPYSGARPDNADRPAKNAFRRPQARPDYAAPKQEGPDHPRGTLWLYGQHAIAAALANPARRLRRLLLTEEAEAALAARLAPPWAIAHERVDRARLDQLLGRDTVHQGAALLADPLATPGLAQTLEREGPILVLDQVSDPRNVGAILRSAAAFGVAAVITQDRNAPDESGALAKAASGALEVVPLLRAVNIARTLIALKAAGAWVIGLDGDATVRLSGTALVGRRVVLVVGAEGDGLRRLTRETCDEIAGLAMPGGMESLNVSAATAIALYELTKTA
jgi:23S rRNA (guanosine2251-2'-O)-methyltransferase